MAKKRPEPIKSTAPSTQTKKEAKPAPMPAKQEYMWMGIAAMVLGFVLYINTFGHDFCLDDYGAIKENIYTKEGIKGIPKLFSSEYRAGSWNSPGSLYRPFTLSMFAVEWQFAPDNPMPGHIMNVLLYALTGLVLFRTWRRVLKDYSPLLAGIITLVFIAHPVHTEVVANIKSRDEILSLLFCTGSLWYAWNWLERKSTGAVLMSILLYTGALFSKESSITWLAILPLTMYFFTEQPLSRILKISAWFLLPAGIFLGVRASVLSNQKGKEIYSILDNFIVAAPNAPSKLASAFMMCWQYLYTLLIPATLVSDRGYPQFAATTFANWQAILGAALFIGMGVWAVLNLKRKHFLAYAILFFLITFSLFSNILITIGTSYGERLLYFPSFGLALAIGWVIYTLHEQKKLGTTAMWAILAGLIGLYSLRTVTRNPNWKTSYVLYKSDYPKSPNCAKLNYHLGIEHAKEALDSTETDVVDPRWLDTALVSYNKAIALYPDYHDVYAGRGLTYFRLKKYDQAFTDYQKALSYRPDDAKVLSNTGFIYFLRNDLAKAEEVYLKAVQIDPRFVDARRNLGAVYAMTKRFPQAIEQFEEGLKYEPKSAILWFYIGSAYKDMGQMDKAQPFLDKAYALNPKLRK